MTPSLEVMNVFHHSDHHKGDACDFDDAILKSNVEDDFDITETEGSEAGDQPTGSRMIDGEDWNHITEPGTHDVLLGRGGGTNNHSGNIKFRKLVNEHKMRYLACSKVEKPKVARQVVGLWRKMEPSGRFLARKDDTKRGPGSVKSSDNVWFEVGDKKAREKASQCLRERTPDVLPYIKHLREQQNAITEQGVSMVQMHMQQHQDQLVQGSHHPHHVNQNIHHPMHSIQNPHPAAVFSNSGFDHQQHPSAPYGGAMPIHPTAAAYPRRNSLPVPQQQPGPMSQVANFPTHAGPRRSSLPLNSSNNMTMMPMAPESRSHNNMGYNNTLDEPSTTVDWCMSPADMSEMEYQHHMMMMQQQMMQQQMQMQRMQQSRAMQHRMRMPQPQGSGGGGLGGNRMDPTVGSSMNGMPHGAMGAPYHNHHHNMDPAAYSTCDPNLTNSSGDGGGGGGHYDDDATNDKAGKSKRGRGSRDDVDRKAAPDRTTSLMSLTPANPDDNNELSLEDYRQQLEEYIANTNKSDVEGDDGDDNNESDLEDDWEKERERAAQQAQDDRASSTKGGRGVSRNVSGMSYLTAKSGGMSLVSGFSGLSDLVSKTSQTERENKMSMARSVGSNISLMSELTDLSHNIDNLSLYDD